MTEGEMQERIRALEAALSDERAAHRETRRALATSGAEVAEWRERARRSSARGEESRAIDSSARRMPMMGGSGLRTPTR